MPSTRRRRSLASQWQAAKVIAMANQPIESVERHLGVVSRLCRPSKSDLPSTQVGSQHYALVVRRYYVCDQAGTNDSLNVPG